MIEGIIKFFAERKVPITIIEGDGDATYRETEIEIICKDKD